MRPPSLPSHTLPNPLRADAVLAGEVTLAFTGRVKNLNQQVALRRRECAVSVPHVKAPLQTA
jgi:hypothetical protein